MIFQWCYERLLPTSNYRRYGKIIQGGEMKNKCAERGNWTSWGSGREMKPVIRLNSIKMAELADKPHHHLH